jgi:hypothetical protein
MRRVRRVFLPLGGMVGVMMKNMIKYIVLFLDITKNKN